MQHILFIFCLVTIAWLQASDDSINYDDAFQRKAQFYLKYGTKQETNQTLHQLVQAKQQKAYQIASLNNSLLQERSNYIDADDRSKKIISTYDELQQAYQDKGMAWWNYQAIHNKKSITEYELTQIDILKQAMDARHNRLILRAQTRALTEQQEKFLHAQRQASTTLSKKNKNAHINENFKQTQKEIKPLLNRMIKQTQKTPPKSDLVEYIAGAKTQVQLDEAKKLKKAESKIHKSETAKKLLAQRQALILVQEEERNKQKEQRQLEQKQIDLERFTLQSLAIVKGLQPIVPRTEAERLAQSQRDKNKAAEQSRELSENNMKKLTDKALKKAFSPALYIKIPVNIHEKSNITIPHEKEQITPIAQSVVNNKNEPTIISSHCMYDPSKDIQNSFQDLLQSMQQQENSGCDPIESRLPSIINNAIALENKIDLHKELFYRNEAMIPLRVEYNKDISKIVSDYTKDKKYIASQIIRTNAQIMEINQKKYNESQQQSTIQKELVKRLENNLNNLKIKEMHTTNIISLAQLLGNKNHKISNDCGVIENHLDKSEKCEFIKKFLY